MKMGFYLFVSIMLAGTAFGQQYQTDKTKVVFFSEAPIEDITATNTNALGILDLGSSKVAFSVPIVDFEFEKSLMKEHFNEKYMETEKYPKATFQGKVLNYDPKKTTPQKVMAKGKMTIHGVEKEVEIPGEIAIDKAGSMTINSVFKVKLEDYNIEIPQLLWNNIAEIVEVTLDFRLKPRT